VIWDFDPRLNCKLLDALGKEPDLIVGDNEPYQGGYSGIRSTGTSFVQGYAHALVEIRQDPLARMKPRSPGAKGWPASCARSLRTQPYGRRAFTARMPERSGASMTKPHAPTMTELEAAAFRRLCSISRDHPEVQNIDLMNLAGFCRNCLSNWIEDAAKAEGVPMDRATAREHVYGMPYDAWKALHQTDADEAKQAAFVERQRDKH